MKYKVLAFIAFVSFQLVAQKKNQNMGFTENKGQIIDQKGKPNPAVKFLLNSNGLNVQLRKNGFSYDVYETKKHPLTTKQKKERYPSAFPNNDKDKFPDYTLEYIYHRIDIDFVNSNPNVVLIKEGQSNDYDNYYNVVSKPEGVTKVHKFKQLTYKNIYPNIDVVFSIPNDSLKTVEYNFFVHPGGKTSDIQMKFKGAQTDLANNKIKMKVRFGEMEETLPMSWTENGNEKVEVAIGYRKIKKNIYGFEIAETISDKTLIIDPVPIRLWGTYYGGEGQEYPSDITTNDNNDVFISGASESTVNIATAGTQLSNLSGTANLFFAKLDPNGNRVWGTYFYSEKGLWNSQGAIIKTDSNSNLYFASKEQYSTNLATTGAFQTVKNNYNDIILVKLNNLGIREWATYYGGNQNEYAYSICIDNSNNVYIAGETSSTDVMASSSAHQTNNGANDYNSDGFIAKFDAFGNRLWGTFYGGTGADRFENISVSNDGFLYATGIQSSSDNIATPGAFQENYNGNNYYGTSFAKNIGAMIVKFTLDGQRVWGTYICDDSLIFRAKLQGDNLYLIGRTKNKTTIATPNTLFENFQRIQAGSFGSVSGLSATENACLVSFNVKTQTKNWGTYFIEETYNIDVNNSGEVYFSGRTKLIDGIATTDGYMINNNSVKAYLIKLNNLGQRIWGTYYGGNGGEQSSIVHLDSQQNIYLFGLTNLSTIGIATPGAHQTAIGNNQDTFLAKFRDCTSTAKISSISPICKGSSLELKASGGTNYSWTGPNGFTSNDQNPIILKASAANSGQYSCAITGTGGCDDTKTIDVLVGDSTAPIPNISTLPTITETCNATVSTIPLATDNCAGTITGTTANPLIYDLAGTYTIVWNFDDGNGNKSTQNQTVIVNPNADVIAPQVNYSLCDGNSNGKETFDLSSKQAEIINLAEYTFSYFKNENDALLQTNKISNPTSFENESNPQTIYVRVLNTVNNCSSLSKIILNINSKPIVSSALLSKCDTFLNGIQTFDLDDAKTQINASANVTFEYFKSSQDLNNGIAIANPTSFSNTISNQIIYVKVSDANTCFRVAELALAVNPINQKTLTDFIKCDDDYDGKVIFDLSEKNNEIATYLPTDNYTYSYYGNLKDAGLGNSNKIAPLYLNTTNKEIIYIRVIGTSTCSSIFKVKLEVLEKPKVNMKDNWSICKGVPTLLTADSGFNSYLWSTGATTPTIIVKQAGNYSLTVTKNYDAISCSTTKDITVVASSKAVITNIETIDWTDTENIITVYVTGDGTYEYSLNGIDYQDSNQFLDINKGEYTVYVRDKNGCGIVKEEAYLLMYRKFFTPNGDGLNDTWDIKFSKNEPGLKIELFDRYGKLIKGLLKNNLEWDGTFDGKELPATDYWFVVTRANGKEHRGHFSLKR